MGYKLTGVYARPNGTEQRIRPKGRTPSSDTILYYDFEHTSGTTEVDVAGNYDSTYTSTPTIGTLASGKKYFDTEGNNYCVTNSQLSTIDYNNCTVNVWLYIQSFNGKSRFGQVWWSVPSGVGTIFLEDYNGFQCCLGPIDNTEGGLNTSYLTGWTNFVMTNDGTTFKAYSNNTQIVSKSAVSGSGSKEFCVGLVKGWDGGIPTPGDTRFGSVIIEDKVRSAQDVADYYNLTKGDYGIS